MDISECADILAVQRLIARFANSFDRKEWDALRDCLSPSVWADYSDLRGTPAQTLTAASYVESRRFALNDLRTHHLCGNVEVSLAVASAQARVSMLIFRRNQDGTIFHTHCLYQFGLVHREDGWRIDSITQKVLMNDGDPRIHRGVGAAGAASEHMRGAGNPTD